MVFGRMNPFNRSSDPEAADAEAEPGATDEDAQPEEEARADGEMPEAGSADRPGIAEKVQFWEEQDRINRELIPRVLKQNEMLSAHIAGHEEVRVQLMALQSRIDELTERHAREMAELQARTSVEVRSWKRLAWGVSLASAGVAVLAVVLALVV